MTAYAAKTIPRAKGTPPPVSIQDRTIQAVPAVKESQSAEGDRPSNRWPPIWLLIVMYLVVIGFAIIMGVIFFGSH
jgi:hypothetical protein